jgi:hypothetical protein
MAECARCKSKNPDRNRFCGACGDPLDQNSIALKDAAGLKLREQVQAILKDQYKDQKLLEVETAQAVATRVAEWGKLLGFFVGIPFALLVVTLGLVGIHSYSDFSSKIESAQADIGAKITDAQKLAAKLQSDGATLSGEYKKLTEQLGNAKAIEVQVEALSNEYQKLAVGLEKTKELASRVDSLDKKVVGLADSIRSGLVLGNSKYSSKLGSLGRPVNDAQAVSRALTELGFKVNTGLNLGHSDMLQAIHRYSDGIAASDVAFIFFSGHGVSINGENFLIPSDADPALLDDVQVARFAMISEREIVSAMQASNARVVVLVIDACRNNPFVTTRTRGLAPISDLKPNASAGIFALYSAGQGEASIESLGADDPDPNSVFTRALIKALRKPGLNLLEMADLVAVEVSEMTRQAQRPSFYNNTTGMVYLAGRTPDAGKR